jgi:hypothetical protein
MPAAPSALFKAGTTATGLEARRRRGGAGPA